MFERIINRIYDRLWGDILTIPLPGGNSLGLSLLVIVLICMGIYCTVLTRFLPIRLLPEMLHVVTTKEEKLAK